MSALVAHLQREGVALSRQVLAAMYHDPFWQERFGGRGRTHADEDSAFHLRYLARSLESGDPQVLVRYARWLREVLASRGMCTRHLAENFRLLADAIAARDWPDTALAVHHLEVARAALAYVEGEPRAVQQLEDRDADSTDVAYCDDPENYLSYLADALAFGSPATLVAHVRWTREWLQRIGAGTRTMDLALAEVARRVRAAGTAPQALAYLEEAQAALREATA